MTVGMTRRCPCLLVGGLKAVLKKVLFVELSRRPPSSVVRCKVVSAQINNQLHEIQDCERSKKSVPHSRGSICELIAVSYSQ
jgi:hypothetical protein